MRSIGADVRVIPHNESSLDCKRDRSPKISTKQGLSGERNKHTITCKARAAVSYHCIRGDWLRGMGTAVGIAVQKSTLQ